MSYRRYTMEVERHQRQTVTFVAEPANQLALDRIAVAHCEDTQWAETTYSHGNLTSEVVEVTGPEDEAMAFGRTQAAVERDLEAWVGEDIISPEAHDRIAAMAMEDRGMTDAILHSMWLHGNWRSITVNLTTEEKEAFANAVERYSARMEHEALVVDRWWR